MGGFERRTPAEMAVIPMRNDVAAALVAAACSSTAVAPFLMCVDRAVVAAAAGTAPGGSLFRAIGSVGGEFVTRPKTAFAQPALWMVAAVYGGTYFAKNVSDVCIERKQLPANHKGANAAKFGATTACNMGGSILKDAAFARLYGASLAAVVLVPPTSYALFAARDCLTIGGAFVVPDALAAAVVKCTGLNQNAAGTLSQLVAPPLMQVICTPMHLLSLSLINDPGATVASRVARLRLATPAALLARSLRMLPAYGVGGILNATLVNKGRAMAKGGEKISSSGKGGGAAAKNMTAKPTTDTKGTDKPSLASSSRQKEAELNVPGGRFFGEGFFGGNMGSGVEGLALGFGLRSALGFGANGAVVGDERGTTRRTAVSTAHRGTVANSARAMRVPPPRFASVMMAKVGDAKRSDDGVLSPDVKQFGDRLRQMSRRFGKIGKGSDVAGQRLKRGGGWRPGRNPDVAFAAR